MRAVLFILALVPLLLAAGAWAQDAAVPLPIADPMIPVIVPWGVTVELAPGEIGVMPGLDQGQALTITATGLVEVTQGDIPDPPGHPKQQPLMSGQEGTVVTTDRKCIYIRPVDPLTAVTVTVQ